MTHGSTTPQLTLLVNAEVMGVYTMRSGAKITSSCCPSWVLASTSAFFRYAHHSSRRTVPPPLLSIFLKTYKPWHKCHRVIKPGRRGEGMVRAPCENREVSVEKRGHQGWIRRWHSQSRMAPLLVDEPQQPASRSCRLGSTEAPRNHALSCLRSLPSTPSTRSDRRLHRHWSSAKMKSGLSSRATLARFGSRSYLRSRCS